jgi:hypothetical protein
MLIRLFAITLYISNPSPNMRVMVATCKGLGLVFLYMSYSLCVGKRGITNWYQSQVNDLTGKALLGLGA